MKALLLAAGEGTRLRPFTEKIPKCLMPIKGRPLIDIWLDELLKTKVISKVLINVFYKKDIVKNYVLKSSWKDFVEIVEEPELLGTAGTIFKNYHFFQNKSFLVAHADNLCITSLRNFIDCHKNRPNNSHFTMMTFKTNTPETCGIIKLNKDNIVEEFYEKEKKYHGNIANGAVYIFDNNFRELASKNIDTLKIPLDISNDLVPLFLNKINTFLNTNIHVDIGNIASWNQANSLSFVSNFNKKNEELWNDILKTI
jgi:mannose-1-phosphate guanylyltransferase